MSSRPPSQPPADNGQRPAPQMRRQRLAKPTSDPLVRPKKRATAASGPRPPPSGITHTLVDRRVSMNQAGQQRSASELLQQHQRPISATQKVPSANDTTVNGFTGPLVSETYRDYPLVTTKKSLLEGLRYHVARFASKEPIDPRDEKQFERPVRLHRRDSRAEPETPREEPPAEPSDKERNMPRAWASLSEEERRELIARKEAKEKEREANLAQIAPSTMAKGKKRARPRQAQTQQVFRAEMSAEEIAHARVKYEEALPWHLEGFDNKKSWVGSYEAALSGDHVVFALDEQSKMRMIPIEKWYKFAPKMKTANPKEREEMIMRITNTPKFMRLREEEESKKREESKGAPRLYSGVTSKDKLEPDDLDYEEDRFADDEENVGIQDSDEDAKLAEDRIKKDQLKANVFGLKSQEDYDKEEEREQKEKEQMNSRYGKKVTKALQKHEDVDYGSTDEDNLFSDSEESSEETDDESTETEEEADSKDPGASNPPKADSANDTTKRAVSGASAKVSRKRVGSPTMSDASGTDSGRKRTKK